MKTKILKTLERYAKLTNTPLKKIKKSYEAVPAQSRQKVLANIEAFIALGEGRKL